VTNSHQVFVVADADAKVRHTGANDKRSWWDGKKEEEEADDEIRKEKVCNFLFFFSMLKLWLYFDYCCVTSAFCHQQ